MKQKLLSLLALLMIGISSVWAQTVPVITTDVDNPQLYTIASYDRGGFITANGIGNGVTHVDLCNRSYWYFTAAPGNETGNVADGVIMHCYDGTQLLNTWRSAENGSTIYIIPNGVNEEGLSISKSATISNNSCMDASNANTGIGSWTPSASDWQGTTWVFAEATINISEYQANAAEELNKYYLASSSLINTYTTKINQATSTSGVDAVLAEAVTAYQNEVNTKVWHIRSGYNGYYNNQSVYKCMTYAYDGGTTIGWATEDVFNPNCYLKIEIIEGGKLNIATMDGQYMQGVAGALGAKSSANAVTLVKYSDGTFNLNFTNGTAHTNGHSSGAGISGNLVNWAGGAGTASSWVFVETTEEAYNTAVNWNSTMFHPTTRASVLDGTYMLYNGCYNNTEDRTGFMKSNNGAIAHVGTHDRALTYQANRSNLWEVHPVDGVENGYTIFNVGSQSYVAANGSKSATPATIYIQPWETSTHTKAGVKYCDIYGERSETDATGFWTIGASASGNNGNNCWNGNPTSFALWSNSHPWAFYNIAPVEDGVTSEMLTIANDYAAHKVSQNAPHTTKYGTFTEATMTSVNTLAVGDTFEQYVTAVNNTTETTVVAPETGSFLIIKGTTGGKYMNGRALSETPTVMWYSEEGKLITYSTGFGFVNTSYDAGVTDEFNTHTFVASPATGSLMIQSNATGVGQFMYENTNNVDRYNTNAHERKNWTVEDATTLPVTLATIDGHNYGTFYSPVGISDLDGVKAYIATEENGVAKMTAIETIPANTAVVLYAKDADKTSATFTIGEADANTDGNILVGQPYNIATVTGACTLQNNAEKGLGFYNYTGAALKGFKAYFDSSASSVKSFALDFDMETAIRGIQETEENSAAMYDMSGRRIQKAQKGVFIQNGKKFVK